MLAEENWKIKQKSNVSEILFCSKCVLHAVEGFYASCKTQKWELFLFEILKTWIIFNL